MHKCPIHGIELRQLGMLGGGEWIAENLWDCIDCRWPKDPKRFVVTKSGVRKVEG